MKKICILISLLIPLVLSTAKNQIVLVATTDVHGALFDHDFMLDRPSKYSLERVYEFVDSLRKSSEVILLDNGDLIQGNPIMYYYNFENTKPIHISAKVLNYMGYDAASVGNHDVEPGHEVYDRLIGEYNFPWLSANSVRTDNMQPYFKPYTIINKNGIKIAILGMTTPGIPKWLPKNIWSGMKFDDMVVTAQRWVPLIQEKEKPDLIVGLFHAGLDYTYDGQNAETAFNENACRLVASRVPGFDLIIAGHDHKPLIDSIPDTNGKWVYLLNPGSHTRFAGVANITKSGEKNSVRCQLVAMPIKPGKSILSKQFSKEVAETRQWVNKPLCYLADTLTSKEGMWGPSKLIGLIHQIQLEVTGADISFSAPLSYDLQINQGNICVRDLFRMYRYENQLFTLNLTGYEILSFLEYSSSIWFNTMQDSTDELLLSKKTGADKNSPYYNYDSGSGISYTIDVSKPAGQRVNIISLSNGKPFDNRSIYKVAMSSYRAMGGGGHLTKGCGIPADSLENRIVWQSPSEIRTYLKKYLESNDTLRISNNINWQVVPENWAQSAIRRYELEK